jgi:hypothetical protein
MPLKSPKKLQNLWADTRNDETFRLQKFIDQYNDSLELEINPKAYAEELIEAMNTLYCSGVSANQIAKNKRFFVKLFNFGQDLIERFWYFNDQYFYLGIFIEIKMPSDWKSLNFFKLLKKIIIKFKSQQEFFSGKIKTLLIKRLKQHRPDLYQSYVIGT